MIFQAHSTCGPAPISSTDPALTVIVRNGQTETSVRLVKGTERIEELAELAHEWSGRQGMPGTAGTPGAVEPSAIPDTPEPPD